MVMDELPELPFEKMLSYLSLEEVIKLRAVSRSCLWKIDNHKVKSLCYSELPIGHIFKKNRWVRGVFAQNFIVSTKFESFFKTFGQTILSNLKYLRFYDLDLNAESQKAAFSRALNSFDQLEELDLIGKWESNKNSKRRRHFELNLPMLKSVRFEEVHGIEKLTLNAPVLKKVKLSRSCFFLDLVHGESVESLLIDQMGHLKVECLKNLKYLYVWLPSKIDLPLLFGLNQLKAIHLIYDDNILDFHNDPPVNFHELFDLKQRYNHTDLEIYHLGCLLNGLDDPVLHMRDFDFLHGEIFSYWAVDPSSLADEVPFWPCLSYTAIEHLTPELQATTLNRLIDLSAMDVDEPLQDIDRFLDFLKTFNHIASLQCWCDQPQALFDRLPEYGGLQKLHLMTPPSDYEFLFRLEHLVELILQFSVAIETIRRALEKLPLLEFVEFGPNQFFCEIFIENSERFEVYLHGRKKKMLTTFDLNDVIQFIEQNMSGELEDMEVD